MLPESVFNYVKYAWGGDLQPGVSMRLDAGVYCVSNDSGRISCTFYPILPLEKEIESAAIKLNTYPHLVDSEGLRKCRKYSQDHKRFIRLSDIPESSPYQWELY